MSLRISWEALVKSFDESSGLVQNEISCQFNERVLVRIRLSVSEGQRELCVGQGELCVGQ